MAHLAKEGKDILDSHGRTTTLQLWVLQGAQYPMSQNRMFFLLSGSMVHRQDLAMPGNIFGCHYLVGEHMVATGIYWVEARDAAIHPTMNRAPSPPPPSNKELPRPECQYCQSWECRFISQFDTTVSRKAFLNSPDWVRHLFLASHST